VHNVIGAMVTPLAAWLCAAKDSACDLAATFVVRPDAIRMFVTALKLKRSK
jgi:hypothetical protein